MKILFVSHDDGKYGAALCLLDLINYFISEKKAEVVVITRKDNEINQYCRETGIENYVLKYVSCITQYRRNFLAQSFWKFVQTLKCDVMDYLLLRSLEKHIDISSFDYIYTNVSTIDFGYVIANKYNIRHCWHIREFGLEDMNAIPASSKLVKRMNNSHIVIAISKAVKATWVSKGVSSDKIFTVYDGVKVSPTYKNEKHDIPKDGKYHLMFMGSSSPHKGLEHLIEAIHIVANTYRVPVILHVYGAYDNDFGHMIKTKIQALNLEENVNFEGFCKDIYNKICSHDIGLVCSKSEGFGRVTAEYMMAGIPVIASNTGANVELIENGKTGYLYEYGNSLELANCINTLLHNPAEMIKISTAAYEKAINNFTISNNAERIYSLLKK